MSIATIGSLGATNADLVLPVASRDLYMSAVRSDVLKCFKSKGIIKFHYELKKGHGDTAHLRNLFDATGEPVVGDFDPYENTTAPVYGDRTVTLNQVGKAFEFTKKNSYSQQLTLVDLEEGHQATHMKYFNEIIIKSVMSQAALNNGTTIDCPGVSVTGLTLDRRLPFTGNNAVNFNATAFAAAFRYHVANGRTNAQSLVPGDVLTTKELMISVENIIRQQGNTHDFDQLGNGKVGMGVISQSAIFNLMNEAPKDGSNWTFSKAYEYAAQAGKIQQIGFMEIVEIIGIPLTLCILPDTYFHPATHSSTAVPLPNTQRLCILGKNAIDAVLGRMYGSTAEDYSPFKIQIDTQHKRMGKKGFGLVEGIYGFKNTQLHKKNDSTVNIPLSTYIIDVHTGRSA